MKTNSIYRILFVGGVIFTSLSCSESSNNRSSSPPALTGNLFLQVNSRASRGLVKLHLPTLTASVFAADMAEDGSFSISPDHRLLAYENTSKKTKVKTSSGEDVFTGNFNPIERYVWTSDSKKVYFANYFEGIYKIDLENRLETLEARTVGFSFNHSIAISPDERIIVWITHTFGKQIRFFKANFPDFSSPVQIYSNSSFNHDEDVRTIFLNNDLIAFNDDRIENEQGVWYLVTLNLKNSSSPSSIVRYCDRFSLSPNRSHIAYSADDASALDTAVGVVDIRDWSNKKIDGLRYGFVTAITWSPSGDYILIAVLRSGGSYVTDLIAYSFPQMEKRLITSLNLNDSWVMETFWSR